MAIIVVSWDNPADPAKLKAIAKKEPQWRDTTLKQPGAMSFQAFEHPLGHSPSGMAVDTFASIDDAQKFLHSKQWTSIISEMRELGSTNIKAEIYKASPTTPTPLLVK